MMESCQKDGIERGQTPVNHFNKEGSVPLITIIKLIQNTS